MVSGPPTIRGNRRLEQIPGPQTVDELPPRENGYAVDFARAWLARDEDAVAECAFVADGSKTLEVVLFGDGDEVVLAPGERRRHAMTIMPSPTVVAPHPERQ